MRGLPRIVAQTPIGKTVDVELLRKGEKKMMKVAVGRLVDDDEKPDAGPEKKPEGGITTGPATIIGLKLSPLTDELRAKYQIDPKVTGVVVLEVDPQSPAAAKAIKVGDVIVEAAQDPVKSPDDIAKSIDKVRKAGRKAVLFRVEDSKGDLRFVAVPLG
jgi:serine protease Do